MPAPRRSIGYPTNGLRAVLDDPAEAAAVMAELRSGGFAAEELERWPGPEPRIADVLRR